MEMRRVVSVRNGVRFTCCLLISLVVLCSGIKAQPPVRNYTIKNNKMYIALGKLMTDASIDSFSAQYNLLDLALKKYVRGNLLDSLKLMGWSVEVNNDEVFIISKPLFGLDKIDDPANKFLLHEGADDAGERFPTVSPGIRYGVNRFVNKSPFAVHDSIVNFYLRGYESAKRVMLAGSFNNWDPGATAMIKTDSGWVAKLPLNPGKYWYKFIVDGTWMTDSDNKIIENDGQGNINSVFFRPNQVFRLKGLENAKRVMLTGSFNKWNEKELPLAKTADGWELPMYLAEGTHTYRFIVDRKWMVDPANPDRYPNEFGEFNSVIKIGKPYLFFLEGFGDAKRVALAGSFNWWRQDELFMVKTEKGWELPYTLGPGNYEYNFIIDGKWASAPHPEGDKNASKNFYFVIGPNYTFQLDGYEDAKSVYLAGDFNNWSPNTFAMKRRDGQWVLDIHLRPGKHLYKFVVDGEWILDPANKLWEQNEQSTGNSVLWTTH